MSLVRPGFYCRYCPACGLMAAFCAHDAPRESIDGFHAMARKLGTKVHRFAEGDFDGLVWCQCEEEAQ